MKNILNKLIPVLGLAVLLSACHEKEIVNISQPLIKNGKRNYF